MSLSRTPRRAPPHSRYVSQDDEVDSLSSSQDTHYIVAAYTHDCFSVVYTRPFIISCASYARMHYSNLEV